MVRKLNVKNEHTGTRRQKTVWMNFSLKQHKKNVTNYNSKYKGNKILMHLTTLK